MIDRKAAAIAAAGYASGYAAAGVSEASDMPQVMKFLALYGVQTRVAWCAAMVTYCLAKACAQRLGVGDQPAALHKMLGVIGEAWCIPSDSCAEFKSNAQARGIYVSNEASDKVDVQPGWLVEYNWTGEACSPDAHPSHIGIVIQADDSGVLSAEGNTTRPGAEGNQANGHCCAARHRTWDEVTGFIRTY